MDKEKDIFSSKKKERAFKNKKNSNKVKNKNIIIALIVAGVIAVTSTVVGIVSHFNKKNNTNQNSSSNTSSSQPVDKNDLNDLGMDLEFPKESKPTYGNTTGDVDKDKVVNKNNKYYKDQENADKTSSIGSSSTTSSTQKEEYEITDKNGEVIDKGEGEISKSFEWDPVLKKYVLKEEVGKYVYADATYYSESGDIIINKGEIVSKESLELAKKYCTTTKPNQNTSSNTSSSNSSSNSSSSTTSSSNTGVVNKDGTYTIFGLTFESKADYEQWILQGYEGYVEIDGIMKSETELNKNSQKTK